MRKIWVGTAPAISPLVVESNGLVAGRVRPEQVAWALVGLGVVVRLVRYLANRSLWLDEAMLSLNVVGRDLYSLCSTPLSHHQGAPPGFLLLEKIAISVLGPSEYALRLVPLLAGAAALPIFYSLARRALAGLAHGWAAVFAVALMSLDEMSVYYASEVKQYSCDLLAAVTLAWLMLRAADGRRRDFVVLAIVGAASVWVSHAAVFVLAAGGISLTVYDAFGQRWKRAGVFAAITAVWAGSFAATWWVNLRGLTDDPYLTAYWMEAQALLPIVPTSLADLYAYPRAFLRLARDIFAAPSATSLAAKLAGGAVFALGCLSIGAWGKRRLAAAVVLVPVALVVFAAMVGKYPMFERLVLFLHPPVILAAAAGAAWLGEHYGRAVAMLTVAAVLAVAGWVQAANVIAPPGRDEIRTVLRQIADREKKDVSPPPLYTLAGARAGVEFYAANDSGCAVLREMLIVHGPAEVWRAEQRDVNEVDAFRAQCAARRVWVVLSTTWHPLYAAQESRVRQRFDAAGRKLAEIHAPGAAAMLYELN